MKFSIITINKNNAAGLEKTFESIFAQTYSNIESVVIDGSSTDDSIEIIKKYAGKISSWISEPDNGVYDAMNKGILRSTGNWIIFMNSGDYFFSENVLSESFNYIINNPKHTIFYGNFIWTKGDIRNFVIAKEAFRIGYTMPTCHQSFIINRNLHAKYLYDNTLKIASDYDFVLKMHRLGEKLKKIPVTISVYQGGGISEKQEFLKEEEFEKVANRYNNRFQNFFYRKILSAKVFESGWRAFYATLFVKKVIGNNRYNQFKKKHLKNSLP